MKGPLLLIVGASLASMNSPGSRVVGPDLSFVDVNFLVVFLVVSFGFLFLMGVLLARGPR